MEKQKISPTILALDILGNILAGFGLFETFGGGGWYPEAFKFPYYSWVITLVGFALTIPFIKERLQFSRRSKS